MGCLGLLWLSLSSTLLLLHLNHNSAQTHVFDVCNINNGANYTANSTFQANLNLLLSSISNTTNQFYKRTIGKGPDGIYGLFQCRGDLNSQDCNKCAKTVSKEITDRCPFKKESIIYYDECWFHYSNNSFLSKVNFGYPIYIHNETSISDPDRLSPVLNKLMYGLVAQAVSNASTLFAAGETNFTTSKKLYGLVECTQDLSVDDCNRCLRRIVSEFPGCCDKERGANLLKPSCIARYETYKFFKSQAIAPAPAAAPAAPRHGKKSLKNIILIVVPVIIVALVLSVISIFFCLKRKKTLQMVNDEDTISAVESLQFNLATITDATDNFNDANLLGEGGFGAVYKGKLSDGNEIAVKRLSKHSSQGMKEFKNEILLLARLQHRNLVRLLGFCLKGTENLLIYEFVPNSSLDKFIFDPRTNTSLDWPSRYKIIWGIARGLLYLHEDSRERIIHRDLKASNILLDTQMNPKISDFGLARLFMVDQTHISTKRIVGTYGYMSPEYAMHGHFSVKSDVFSYGVLVLEIITGHKNNSFYESEHAEDLLSYVWRQWENGNALEVLDPLCKENCCRNEVMRCIHLGLLCVQEDMARRPTMASVDLMLSSYSIPLVLPSTPAFLVKSGFDMIPEETPTINETSITESYPR